LSKNLLQVFKNSNYGEVRTVVVNGEPYFGATDVAKSLGYAKPNNAIKAHCKGTLKRGGVSKTTNQYGTTTEQIVQMNFIPIGDVCRLAASSQLPGAEKFESWIFDEVIPTVLKTGAYITNKADPEMLRKQADRIETVDTINSLAQTLLPVYSAAGMKPQFQLMALKQLYGKANLELPTEGVTFDKELFDTMKIASRLGILSTNGKPHGHAVHAILSKISISESERELVPYTRNGHSGTMYQYTESVVEKVRKWLMENGYPETVIKDSGKRKTIYRVDYKVNGGVAV